MKQIKQIHQTLELNLNRLQKTIDDLREVAGGHYDLTEEEKSFKLGELTCMLSISLEDLKLDLDELGREISKQDVESSTPATDKETAKPEATDSIEGKLKKSLKDIFEEKLKAIIKEREEGKGRSWVYTYSEPNYNLDNQNSTGNPNKYTSYTTSGNAPGLRDYLTANPPKEFTTGYSEIGLHEDDRIVDTTWHNENGINYLITTKHNKEKGYMTKVHLYLKNKNINTVEECIDIVRPIIEKIGIFKWLPIRKKSAVAYVSEESFKGIHKELVKQFNSYDVVKPQENSLLGTTTITSTCSEKLITLSTNFCELKIEAVKS